MYLSRIELDTNKRDTMRALSSLQVLHAAVESCYADFPKGNASRRLWRIDRLRGRLYLLILGPAKPDFTRFSGQFCSPDAQGESKLYDDLLSKICVGQRWKFRLRANPVHSVKENSDKRGRGKVYAHVTIEQQKDWLRQRSQPCGFLLKSGETGDNGECFDVIQRESLRFIRNNQSVTLGVATFEGVLSVADSELFTKALTEGVGRAKAYGCGLLTVAGMP